MPNARTVVRFVSGQPVEVTLAGDPRPVQGQFGPQIMYGCEAGKVIFADPGLAAAIQAAHAASGDTISITRHNGNGKPASWAVAVVACRRFLDETAHNPAADPAPPVVSAVAGGATAALRQIEAQADRRGNALYNALCAAIAAAAKAEAFAELQYKSALRFSPADIKSMALALLIAEQKGVLR
ncbi:MAG: hypothetical protein HY236_07145 [Acidobacteria bacterium]|nr:hypothetical protein [Acidobacteriota bacterium]